MYNTNLAIENLTLDEILKHTTEYDIYSYYIPGTKFEVGKVMSSPFRKDRNPSFAIFKDPTSNKLFFKDHGTGLAGDCIKFISELYSLTYKQALEKIFEDIINSNLKHSTTGIYIQEEYKRYSKIISVKYKNYTQSDDQYWDKYKVITRNTLKHFNVHPISHVWLNDKIMSWIYTKDNPMYAYSIYSKYKIYRPYADRKKKWLSNCGLYDIQGWEQLNRNQNTLIITKSLKDVMVLYELGYESIAPQGEHNSIPTKVMKEINYWYDKIFVLYDNDNAGLSAMDKLKNKYPHIITISLPSKEKDISDYIENHSITNTKILLKKLLNA